MILTSIPFLQFSHYYRQSRKPPVKGPGTGTRHQRHWPRRMGLNGRANQDTAFCLASRPSDPCSLSTVHSGWKQILASLFLLAPSLSPHSLLQSKSYRFRRSKRVSELSLSQFSVDSHERAPAQCKRTQKEQKHNRQHQFHSRIVALSLTNHWWVGFERAIPLHGARVYSVQMILRVIAALPSPHVENCWRALIPFHLFCIVIRIVK